jgi:hypothetical protein
MLNNYGQVNPLPRLQVLTIVPVYTNILFDCLYASVFFKFHSTLTQLNLALTKESEEAAAEYGGLYQYISLFENLDSFTCSDSQQDEINTFDFDISALLERNRKHFYCQLTAQDKSLPPIAIKGLIISILH